MARRKKLRASDYPTGGVRRGPWVMFTKRTEEPKLCWLENRLSKARIHWRRRGHSFHAPILEVREEDLERAWKILTPRIDNMPDDSPIFRKACDTPDIRRARRR